jgi:hypothetical protein
VSVWVMEWKSGGLLLDWLFLSHRRALFYDPGSKLVRIAGTLAASVRFLLRFFLLVGHESIVSYWPQDATAPLGVSLVGEILITR